MADGDPRGRRPGDDELPPDPFAGAHVSPPSRGAPPPDLRQPDIPQPPTADRSLWQRPGIWIALVVLAIVMLVGALLDPLPSPPSEPSPGSITT